MDAAVWKVLVILTGAGVEGAGIQFMCFSRSEKDEEGESGSSDRHRKKSRAIFFG